MVGSIMAEDNKVKLLEARISNLEAQVRFLLRINGLDMSEIRTTPKEILLEYYQDAVQLLGVQTKEYVPEVCEPWAELFIQLSEYEFIRLQEVVNYTHTWEPFYQLCVRMMTATRQHPDMGTSLAIQHLYALLDKGRKNLRSSAVIMMKNHPDDVPARAKLLLRGDDLAFSLQK